MVIAVCMGDVGVSVQRYDTYLKFTAKIVTNDIYPQKILNS